MILMNHGKPEFSGRRIITVLLKKDLKNILKCCLNLYKFHIYFTFSCGVAAYY